MEAKLPTWEDYLEERRRLGLGYPTPAEEKKARAYLSRRIYNYKKRIQHDLADLGTQQNIMLSGLRALVKTKKATEIQFYTREGRFQTYPRVKLKLPDGTWTRYYFNKGQWRKS